MNKLYFNDKYSQVKLKRQIHKDFHFDLETENGYAGGQEALIETWNELKYRLNSRDIEIDCLNDIPNIPFLGVLDKALSYEFTRKRVNNDIYYFSKSKKFYRAAIIKQNEIVDISRFIPNANFMISGNRFSPKGAEWLYMGLDRNEDYAKRCCFAEVRANEASNVKYCEFTSIFEKNDLLIDLTISDGKSIDNISHVSRKPPHEKYAQIFIIELYMKLLSEEIFKPIDTLNKDLEYTPFQFMANYFKALGYKGIIYKSTVSDYGKNIVVFDKNFFVPQGIVS